MTFTEGSDHKSLNTNQSLGVKVATPVGTLVGQLLFGWLADVVGRKKMCKWLDMSIWILSLIFSQRRFRAHHHHLRYLRSGSQCDWSFSKRHWCVGLVAFPCESIIPQYLPVTHKSS